MFIANLSAFKIGVCSMGLALTLRLALWIALFECKVIDFLNIHFGSLQKSHLLI
jgi:hypothetical protein